MPETFYQNFFTVTGAHQGGVYDYWSQVSFGHIALDGTEVLPWVPLKIPSTQDASRSRQQQIQDCVDAYHAAYPLGDLSHYYGLFIIQNNLGGEFGGAQRTADLHSALFEQLVLADLIANGEFDRHIRRTRLHYRGRLDRVVAALAPLAPQARLTGVAAGHTRWWGFHSRSTRPGWSRRPLIARLGSIACRATAQPPVRQRWCSATPLVSGCPPGTGRDRLRGDSLCDDFYASPCLRGPALEQ